MPRWRYFMKRWLSHLITVVILLVVSGCSTASPPPTPTPPGATPTATAQVLLPNHTNHVIGDNPARAPAGQFDCLSVIDLNFADYPKYTVVHPAEKFVKKWLIQNNCDVSTEGWYIQAVGGDVIGPVTVMLPNIPSKEKAEFSQELIAPKTDPGVREAGVYDIVYRVFNKNGVWASGFWAHVGIQ